jgi:hypothetical protein
VEVEEQLICDYVPSGEIHFLLHSGAAGLEKPFFLNPAQWFFWVFFLGFLFFFVFFIYLPRRESF